MRLPGRHDRLHQLRRRRLCETPSIPSQTRAERDRRVETDEDPVLAIRDLRVTFPTESGEVQAVRGVDLNVGPGEMLGVVGESGSGKSVTFLAAMGLLPKSAKIEGSAKVHGHELVGMKNNDMRTAARQADLDDLPGSAVGAQPDAQDRPPDRRDDPQSHRHDQGSRLGIGPIELLDLVGIPQPRTRASQYPHEFSGGMRQRVMIAIAIANDPEVLIADEPTTALDVTVQAQILDVIQRIQHKFRASVVFITHDLGVVARIADRVQVMYAGRTVERGDVESIFRNPTHPYTRGLLASLPALGRERLTPIPGAPPNMLRPPSGCAFRPRCPYAEESAPASSPSCTCLLGLETACVRAEELLVLAAGRERERTLPANSTATRPATTPVLEVTDLVKEFPVRQLQGIRVIKGLVQAVSNGQLLDRRRHHAGPRRRERLGQVDRGPLRAAAARADRPAR